MKSSSAHTAEKFNTSRANEYAKQSRIALAGYDASPDEVKIKPGKILKAPIPRIPRRRSRSCCMTADSQRPRVSSAAFSGAPGWRVKRVEGDRLNLQAIAACRGGLHPPQDVSTKSRAIQNPEIRVNGLLTVRCAD